ncbi:outer membrane lipoprotein carrier protein LolA [Vibrio gangliei]|uniref:outer membrane lipoprotein carrier protein LolA n=1 Tax=Vibrio gangliei TaxID=2077090 RepID=UPI000D013352|nr:outer membrane lipoprotein carrier protein LolA [Vibrio gangliei]
MRNNKRKFLLGLSGFYIVISLLFSQLTIAAQNSSTQSSSTQSQSSQSNASQNKAVQSIEQLQQQLASHAVVRGDFSQTRHMQMFDAPLTSQGQFLLSREHGLHWQQTTPFATTLILTQDSLSQQVGSEPAQVLKVSDNPMVFYFSHVFLSLFKGDTSQLTEQFTFEFQPQVNQAWQLRLLPKQAPLDKVFKQIVIEGKQDIDGIELQEIRGDRTDITFSNQTHQPETLTAAEQAAFNL